MTVGEKIKAERIRKGFSQEALANAIGTTKQAIYKYETGIVTNIPMDKIAMIAAFLSITPAYLMGWEEQPDQLSLPSDIRPVTLKRFPMLGNVACGEPIWAEEERGTFVDGAEDIDADFCLTAKGDSMINARIFDGDILFVKQQPMVDDGEIAVVLVDNEATVKRVYYDRDNNVITLVPENPTHKPMRFEGAKLDEITILGKVVAGQFAVR